MILIGYGSETGTAQATAEYISRECVYRGVESKIHPLNDVSIADLQNVGVAVMVCSTTGDGEEPKNMKSFWRSLLSRSLKGDTFTDLNVAVLGLGDSSYCKFNYVAKRLYRRLTNLGKQTFAIKILNASVSEHNKFYLLKYILLQSGTQWLKISY